MRAAKANFTENLTLEFMMRLDEIYTSSKYLKADDLGDQDVQVTVSQWEVQEVQKDGREPGTTYTTKQIVLHFAESEKLFGLNKTNGFHIAELLDQDDPSKWPGAVLVLYKTRVPLGNKMVDAVRVRNAFYPETKEDAPF